MRICVLMGSPRLNGNTAELLKPFMAELKESGAEVEYITLVDKNILSCKSCYSCQDITGKYGCVLQDDMQTIVSGIVKSDCFVLATPIYTWYCTAEMKTMLDRLYGMNKYYGNGSGSLWAGKTCAIIATHGYEADYAIDTFETGIRRLCKHSKLNFIGVYSVRDGDSRVPMQTEEEVNGAREFARKVISRASARYDG